MLGDKYTTHISKSQIGFFSFMIQPFFEVMSSAFPKLSACVTQNKDNCEQWKLLTDKYTCELEDLNANK